MRHGLSDECLADISAAIRSCLPEAEDLLPKSAKALRTDVLGPGSSMVEHIPARVPPRVLQPVCSPSPVAGSFIVLDPPSFFSIMQDAGALPEDEWRRQSIADGLVPFSFPEQEDPSFELSQCSFFVA